MDLGKRREKARARTSRWRAENPGKARDTRLKTVYGITLADRDAMLEAQGGRCANLGCRTDTPGGRHNTFHVDHDHVTGKVRGLLCYACNSSLGFLGDGSSNERIQGLYEYAVEHGPKLIGGPGALFELRPVEHRKAT